MCSSDLSIGSAFGINMTSLLLFIRSYEEHGDSSAKQLHIKIKDILYQMIELASGDFNGPPKIPMVFPEANNKRLVIFMPKAEPMDYEKLKSTYMAERAALAAA